MPLRICGIPELVQYLEPSVTHVVSLLDPAEPEPAALQRLPAANRHLFRLHDSILAQPDEVTPDPAFIESLLDSFARLADEQPQRLLIHCHAGRSRSTAAAMIWLWQGERTEPGPLAERMLAIRSIAWPNSLILRLADERLKTGGVLSEAGRRLRRATALREAAFVAWLRGTHRVIEVEEALAEVAAEAKVTQL